MKKHRIDNTVVLSCILMVSIGFEMGGFQATLREISEYFSIGKISMGLLVSSQYLSIIVMPAVFGRIADRVGKKRVLLVFMGLFCLGTFLVGSSHWFPLTLISFFLIGAGYGVAESVCTALLSDKFGQSAHRYINLSQAFLCIGAVIAPLFASTLFLTWRCVFFTSGVICLIALVLLIFESGLRGGISSSSKLIDISLFKSKLLILLFCSMIIYVGLENGFGYFAESIFYESYSSLLGSYAISLYWVFMAISRILSSFSSKNLYTHLLYRFISISMVFFALYFSKHPYFSLFLCAAVGFCYGPIWSYIMSLAASMYPEKTASIIGMISSGCGIGGALFPILMGVIARNLPISSGFLFLSASSGIACLFVYIASSLAKTSNSMHAEKRYQLRSKINR